ncbi:MAG: type II toxin-antitoxin system Phd/YefM family antitoxin [Thermoanaerobaculaceae bacterium]|jgi:prevent-host-death family protein|nr:type II toxin-antitoxin system Phd/YefM family antitoxin [Thermoanaerobaculaceae bacterium]
MNKVPDIVPITDLRQDAAAVVGRARSKRQPIIITQRGRAVAVMVSVEEYERVEQERQILLLLAKGDKEIAAGRGVDLDAVLAEADALLEKGRE